VLAQLARAANRSQRGGHAAGDLRWREHSLSRLLMPAQHRASRPVVATLRLLYTHAPLINAQHALRHGLHGVPDGRRGLPGAHRPVGDRAHLEQQRAASREELPGAGRSPRLDHAVQRSEQEQPAALRVAKAVNLAEQISWPRQIAARSGADDRESADAAHLARLAHRDDGLRLERVLEARDRAVKRFRLHPVELPDDVIAPVEAPEDRIEHLKAGTDSLRGSVASNNAFHVAGPARVRRRVRVAGAQTDRARQA
jgi:hypothetical protein